MYIPRGKITLGDAVTRMMAKTNPGFPKALARLKTEQAWADRINSISRAPAPIVRIGQRAAPSRPAQIARPAITLQVQKRLQKFRETTEALEKSRHKEAELLRAALAEGDLQASELASNGIESPIQAHFWRTDEAFELIVMGRLANGTFTIGAILSESDFDVWLEPPPQGSAKPTPEALRSWMAAAARQHFRDTGEKPYQVELVQRCQSEMGCSGRAAGRAFTDGVPAAMKRDAKETRRSAQSGGNEVAVGSHRMKKRNP